MSLRLQYLRAQLQKADEIPENSHAELYFKRAVKIIRPDDRKIMSKTLPYEHASPPVIIEELEDEHAAVKAAILKAWWCLETAEKLFQSPSDKARCQFERGLLLIRLHQKSSLPYSLTPEVKADLLVKFSNKITHLMQAVAFFTQASENGCLLANFMLVRGLLIDLQLGMSTLKSETFHSWITQCGTEHLTLGKLTNQLNIVLSNCAITQDKYISTQNKLLHQFDPCDLNQLLLEHPRLSECIKEIMPSIMDISRKFFRVWNESVALRAGTRGLNYLRSVRNPHTLTRYFSEPMPFTFLRKQAKPRVGTQPEPDADAERYFVSNKRPAEREETDEQEAGVKKLQLDSPKPQ